MNRRPEPKRFEVISTAQITPNMRRVTIGGPAMAKFPLEQDGGYVKLMLPGPDEKQQLRTYTIRRQTDDALDIDFALHGDHGSGGPAVSWAQTVTPGETINVGGPGPAKPLTPGADWYLVLGDMTALPAIAVNLSALPDDAVGDAVIEIQSEDDRQNISHPKGITLHWIINPEPGQNAQKFEQFVRELPWREGRVYGWCAAEFETMRHMRTYLREERGLSPDQLYISSYWKQGLGEDQHRVVKQADAETVAG